MGAISDAVNGFAKLFYFNNDFFFYYTIALFLLAAIALAFSCGSIRAELAKAKRKHLEILAAVIIAFAIVEIAFIPLTIHLYSDEYIYMSMAKTMLYDHTAGICSFSTPQHCIPGTLGLFQQPVGWPLILAITYAVSGISLYGGLNATLILSAISIFLVFLIALIMFEDSGMALLGSCLFAATPLFLSYSRTMVSDTPMLTFMLLAVMLSLLYAKTRKMTVGIAAVAATLYTLLMKADAVLMVLVVAGCAISYWKPIVGGRKGAVKEIMKVSALAALFLVLALPQFAFLYNSNMYNSFGAPDGQKFSLDILWSNLPENVSFFLGKYAFLVDPIKGFEYNIEYPVVYTAFATIGAALLLYKRKFKEAGALLIWFFSMFMIYTAYYAGGALFSVGIDIRYFLGIFPVVAILASYGLIGTWKLLSDALGRASRKAGSPGRNRNDISSSLLLALLLLLVFAGPVAYFISIVITPPQNIYAFAAEREEQSFVLGEYNSIPQNCFVLTYVPTLWYVLNRSSAYASWMNNDRYRSIILNESDGCVYFLYDLDCQTSTNNPQYDNSKNGCAMLQRNFAMEPVATDPYDNYGWKLTFGLYKVTGYSNGTSFR
jgi:hypothetical protein